MKKRIFAVVVMTIVLSVLLAFSASAETVEPHWVDNGNGTWSYMEANGELVKDDTYYWVEKDQAYYGFDKNGIMYTGWVQPYLNDPDYLDWPSQYRRTWFYYDASGRAAEPGYNAEAGGYLFDWGAQLLTNGSMMEWDEAAGAWRAYASDKDGIATELVAGWNNVDGIYYYLIEENGDLYWPEEGINKIGENEFYFYYNGRLAENEWVGYYDEADDWYKEVYAIDDGYLVKEGWVYEPDGAVQYIMDGERLTHGAHEIDGELYYFVWDGLVLEDGYYDGYYLDNGKVLRNQWYQDEDGDYMYFDAYGDRYEYGWYTINGSEFRFESGYLVTDRLWERYDSEQGEYVWYVIDQWGYINPLADGWTLIGERWVYMEDGELYSNDVYNIGGTEYAFDGYYLIDEERTFYYIDEKTYDYNYVLVNENGVVDRASGWKLFDGRWVFGEVDGTLRQGWLYDNGNWYYMGPTMYKNTVSTNGGRNYYFNESGKSIDVTVNGFYKVSAGSTYYFEYGQPASGWRLINGNWYFFNTSMYANGSYDIGEDLYYFDANGVMLTGWFKDRNNEWRYADANGHLIDMGMHEVGGVTYFFDDYGRMVTDTNWWYEDVNYLLDENGAVILKSTDAPGWKLVGNTWYYLFEDGEFADYGYYYIDDAEYYFRNYKMVEEEIVNGYYYAKGGALVESGWILLGDKWYYASPYSGGYLAQEGVYHIDGEYYVFHNYEMQVGSFVHGSDIIVTNASGAVVALQPFKEGWNLVNEYGNGVYYYVEDGELYHGWKDGYYLDPQMAANTIRFDGDDYYYFDGNGVYAKNAWVKYYNNWIYAQEDGTLVLNDWLYLNGVWFYFDSLYMVEDGVFYIDEEAHEFAEGGAWIGVYDEDKEYAEGWHMIDGVWQYRQNGSFLYDTIRNINGVWYGFDDEGMATNAFNGYGYYMDGSGVVQFYVGWQLIDGEWYYFSAQNRAVFGWFTVGGVQYYGTRDGIYTGYAAVDGKLYAFAESGANTGVVTGDGWYQNGEDWYYVKNGKALYDCVETINGAKYVFDYDGKMLKNTLYYDYDNGDIYLLGEGGNVVTTQGWYMIEGEWLYVDANGYLCEGIHDIDGVRYVFDLWAVYLKTFEEVA